MKIGILTFHFAHNYGAMLQSYALCSILLKQHNAYIIDYRLPYIYKNFEAQSLKDVYRIYTSTNSRMISILKTLKNYYKYKFKSKKWLRFEAFLNEELRTTNRIYNIIEINSLKFDAIIFGSDQIWNEHLTGGYAPIYFGVGLDVKKKIAYAASNGRDTIPQDNINDFFSLSKNYSKIGVREKGLSAFLNKQGLKNFFVSDPVFFLSKEQWSQIASYPRNKNYLLVYSFDEVPGFFAYAMNLAKKLNKQMVCLLHRKKRLPKNVTQVLDSGPKEFIGYFCNADYILTTSFHGTAFAIIFNKQFCVLPPHNTSERINSLLQILNLNNRIINDVENLPNFEKINYSEVNKKLETYKNESLTFLYNSLNS